MARLQEMRVQYVAHRDDPVDWVLADRINGSPPPAPFFRIRQGEYLFGTTECRATLEQGRLLLSSAELLQVSNPLPYDAFVDFHGSAELEALSAAAETGR